VAAKAHVAATEVKLCIIWVKWSYGKLLPWAGIVSIVSLIFYSHTVMSSSSIVSALPVVVFGVIGTVALLASMAVIWRHNQLVYPRQYAEWDRSFVCQRCGVSTRTSS